MLPPFMISGSSIKCYANIVRNILQTNPMIKSFNFLFNRVARDFEEIQNFETSQPVNNFTNGKLKRVDDK